MTLDPHTVRLLRDIPLREGPVFFCDVDEVVLAFIGPYRLFLESRGMALGNGSFGLHGNVRRADGSLVDDATVTADIDRFFADQASWQTLVPGAREGLAALAERGDVILLTAMWHRHLDARAGHLAGLGLPYPLVTTEGSKGRAIAHAAGSKRAAFVDDLPRNHEDVGRHAPGATRVHFMADRTLAPLLPPLPDGVHRAGSWPEIVDIALQGVREPLPAH